MKCYKRVDFCRGCPLRIFSRPIYPKIWMYVALILISTSNLCLTESDNLSNHIMKDYCIGDTEIFEPKCLKGEVVVMTGAVYGRMRVSRCLESEGDMLKQAAENPQILGCSVDVLHILDSKCSGTNGCTVRGSDKDLRQIQPCWSALKSYLSAGFDCVKLIEEDRFCSVTVTSSVQYLMYGKTSEQTKMNCGTRQHPWRLEAPLGQQINVSLLHFSSTADSIVCSPVGYLHDMTGNKNITICSTANVRRSVIYKSSANVVNLVLNNPTDANSGQHKFLLGFVAVGCTDVVAPVDSWMRRKDDEAIVGCYTSRQTWRIICVNNHWTGVIGNCTRDTDLSMMESGNTSHQKKSMENSNEVIVICVIVSLMFIICTVIVCLGIVCLRRYYATTMRSQKFFNNPGQKQGELLNGFQGLN